MVDNLAELGRGNEPEKGHEIEDAAEAQKSGNRESLSDALISGAETPQEVYMGLRLLEAPLEDSRIPPNLSERYTPPRQLSVMYERAKMMAYSIDDLQKRKLITTDPSTGEVRPKDERYASLAVNSTRIEKTDKRGRFIGYEIKYNFGTNESRERLRRAYERAWVELSARDILGEHVGLRLAVDVRDSLETLVAVLHGGRMPKFKPEHLEAIFNMASVAEMESNPKNHHLGDMVEEAMFLNLVMLNSGNKQRMLDFLERPGSKHLIAKMAKEWGVTYDQWMHENIGDVEKWEDDSKRLLTDEGEDNPATWRREAADGRRGILTKWSNIVAWAGAPAGFSHEMETEFIEKTIGGLVGGGDEGVEASWVAASIMRGIGAYASEGYVALPNGKSILPLGEGRFFSGDDTGKFHTYMWNYKEGTRGRTSGLRGMIGRFPDIAMNLFDWAQVTVKYDENGKPIKRSIWDAWLGTAGGKPIVDIVTGKPAVKIVNGKREIKTTSEEGYKRLGDLDFKSLEREFHGQFTIMQWLMGNREAPTGILIDALAEEFKPEDFKINKNKKRWKYIGIVMNPVVMTQGSTHLYDLGEETKNRVETLDLTGNGVMAKVHVFNTKGTETIQRRFFKNLMASRILSSEFSTEMMPLTKKIFDIRPVGGNVLEVPFVTLVNLWCKEVFKPNPQDEDQLIAHYIDDLTRLQGLEGRKEAIKYRDEATTWFTNEVGRVIGRKTIST